MLLDKETLKCLGTSLKIATYFGVSQYKFDLKSRRIVLNTSLQFYCHFAFNVLVDIVAQVSFILFTIICYKLYLDSAIPISLLIAGFIGCGLNALYTYLDYILWKYRSEISLCANSIIKLIDSVDNGFYGDVSSPQEKSQDNELAKHIHKLDWFLRPIFIKMAPILVIQLPFFYWNSIFIIATQFIVPIQTFLNTTLSYVEITILILLCLPSFYYVFMCLLARFYGQGLPTVIFGLYVNYILKNKICFKTDNNVKTSEVESGDQLPRHLLRHPLNSIKIYRMLHITFEIIFNQCFSNMLAFGLVLTFSVSSGLLYFAIGHKKGPILEKILAVIIVALASGYMTYILHLCGSYYATSVKLIQDWNHDYMRTQHFPQYRTNRELERRIFIALRPIKIYAGSCYFLDEKNALVYWNLLISRTIELLFCFPFIKNSVK